LVLEKGSSEKRKECQERDLQTNSRDYFRDIIKTAVKR
jgi:hypothetical protein